MPLLPDHVKIPSGLRNSGWSGHRHPLKEATRFWWAATTTVLAGRLSERVQREANVCEALVSFLALTENWETTRKVLHASTLPLAHQNPP